MQQASGTNDSEAPRKATADPDTERSEQAKPSTEKSHDSHAEPRLTTHSTRQEAADCVNDPRAPETARPSQHAEDTEARLNQPRQQRLDPDSELSALPDEQPGERRDPARARTQKSSD